MTGTWSHPLRRSSDSVGSSIIPSKKTLKMLEKKNEMFIRLQNTIEFADEDFKEKCVYMYVYLFLKT